VLGAEAGRRQLHGGRDADVLERLALGVHVEPARLAAVS
jgi:hypothetical protein